MNPIKNYDLPPFALFIQKKKNIEIIGTRYYTKYTLALLNISKFCFYLNIADKKLNKIKNTKLFLD